MMELGAVGGISVVANVIPKGWSEMIQSFLQGNQEKARELNALYVPLFQAMELETNPNASNTPSV